VTEGRRGKRRDDGVESGVQVCVTDRGREGERARARASEIECVCV